MAGVRRMRRKATPVEIEAPALRRSCSNPTLEYQSEGKGRMSAMVVASSGAKKLVEQKQKLEKLSKQLRQEKLEEDGLGACLEASHTASMWLLGL